jgi:predicted transcriptional regulator
MKQDGDRVRRDGWTLLSNHGHVLVCLARDPQVLLRDVAASVGITERAAQQIVGDLERGGVIARLRVGRRNHYVVRRETSLRHWLEAMVTVGDFVELFERDGAGHRRIQGAVEFPSSTGLHDIVPRSAALRSIVS